MTTFDPEYFQSTDTDALYACIGPLAATALFVLVEPKAAHAKWHFLVPASPSWDAAHQRIYRQFHVKTVQLANLPAGLPPLPAIPPGPFPSWQDNFEPRAPVHASQFPLLCHLLAARGPGWSTVVCVLEEDRCETVFGDGEFHYFSAAFLTTEEAHEHAERNAGKYSRFHVRTLAVRLEGEGLVIANMQVELFDRYTAQDALSAVEGLLRGQARCGT